MSLTYDDGSHRYRLDGRQVANVTTVLSGGLPKPQLVNWAARTVAEYVATDPEGVDRLRAMGWEPMVKALAAVPDQRRDEAAARGTRFHDLADLVSQGGPVEVAPALADMARGYVRWLDTWSPDVVLTESIVASRTHRYAGRFDLLAWLGSPRRLWLLDVKTSRAVYGDTALQCAAYARAEFYVTPDGDEVPLPPVERIGVLHVTDMGTDLYDLGDVDAAWAEFQAALATYRGSQRRRNIPGAPLEPEDLLTGAVG